MTEAELDDILFIVEAMQEAWRARHSDDGGLAEAVEARRQRDRFVERHILPKHRYGGR